MQPMPLQPQTMPSGVSSRPLTASSNALAAGCFGPRSGGPCASASRRVRSSSLPPCAAQAAVWRVAGEQSPRSVALADASVTQLELSAGLSLRPEIGSPGSPGAGSVASESRVEPRPSWQQSALRILRLSLRIFGGRQWSLPGLILRLFTLQVLIALVVQRRSWREALWGAPLCQSTDLRTLPEEQRDRLIETGARACTLVAAVHQLKEVWIDEMRHHGYELLDPQTLGIELEGSETWTQTCLYDPKAALKAIVAHDRAQNEWVLVFGAQNCLEAPIPLRACGESASPRAAEQEPDEPVAREVVVPNGKFLGRFQIAMGLFNLLGGRSPCYMQAASLAARLQRAAEAHGVALRCVGQSLGGSLATYAALRAQVPATVFNPIALGAGLQAELGEQCLKQGAERIDVFTAASDWASDPHWVMRSLTEGMNVLGVRTAAVVGRQWVVPSAYDSAGASHDFIVGTFSNNLEGIRARQMGCAARDPDQVKRCRPSEIRPWSPALASVRDQQGLSA